MVISSAVFLHGGLLKLTKPNNPMAKTKWLTADKEYLQNNYGSIDTEIIQQHLNRTQSSIHTMAAQLGITRTYGKKVRKPTKKQIERKRRSEKHLRLNQRSYKTKEVSYEGKRAVKIDSKTHVFIDVNASPDEVEWILKQYKRK
jgi:hypothetical protein